MDYSQNTWREKNNFTSTGNMRWRHSSRVSRWLDWLELTTCQPAKVHFHFTFSIFVIYLWHDVMLCLQKLVAGWRKAIEMTTPGAAQPGGCHWGHWGSGRVITPVVTTSSAALIVVRVIVVFRCVTPPTHTPPVAAKLWIKISTSLYLSI